MKKTLFFILSLTALVLLSACGNTTPTVERIPEAELREFTLEELSQYDGLDGRQAYIAVNGFVYDVSDSARWRGGSHNGFRAGADLTEEIQGVSPHGTRVLDNIPRIGRLIEE